MQNGLSMGNPRTKWRFHEVSLAGRIIELNQWEVVQRAVFDDTRVLHSYTYLLSVYIF